MSPAVRSHRFISHFPAVQGARLAARVRLVRFPHQAMIFDEGTRSDCIYLVLNGRVALTKRTFGGGSHLVAYKSPDDYFGELGVLDGSVRSTAAVADGPVLLGRIAAHAFLRVLAKSSWHTVLRLFSHISEDLRATNDRYVVDVVRKEKITLIGEMANSMIHDFRSPFTTIRLVAESVALRHPDAKTQEYAATIMRQVDRMSGMMEEVLEFARGQTALRLAAVPLREILAQLHEDNADALKRAGVAWTCRPGRLILPLDRARIQRVLQNLVANALDALAGRTRGRITLAVRSLGRQALITVDDNGPGIPRAIRHTLFEPFVTHGKTGGTGLGLALAKAVVEAHHGTITCRSSRRGTTFSLRLPLSG